MTVRTVNGVATEVDYHAHDDKGSGYVHQSTLTCPIIDFISTIPWDRVPKFDNNQRPVAYVAKGSHGMWSSAGTFTYVNAVIFKLQDITSDGGVHWDSKNSIVPFLYPDTYSGDLGWLNFKGLWGNKGTTNCWWHSIFSECEVVDGPGGPIRDDVFSAASIRSVRTVDVASNVKLVSPKFRMTGPLSVRSHPLLSLSP